ncbi:Thyrotropin-releasing hormone-degrading ectoenzyme [Cyphomyrmex costatus]|uniref:Thyrotropin-releasing hormone-degrading ectoenzyme n=1 Tax=Cyphomyrmex costatus TaxID=456900 RepID=A0A151I705_9HYME|nr:Thyrotropin-releasing hormone-degrading ectoenzyme [Cyphomyrmex costatus]
MLATQFYPIGARQVFPCFDDPSFKATFNISIKHFAHYMALSNMPVRNTNRASLTMEWTHFQRTPVMSTYLLVIMLSDFPRTSVKEINFRYHRSQPELGTEFAQRVIQNISLHFKSEWLRFQKLPKVDHVVLPNFLRNGVEYWGLIFYRESDILYIEELYSVGRKVDIARLIAQKIAYQWYEFRIWDLFIVQIQQESLRLESIMKPVSSEVNTPSDINLVFSFEYYLKGPALLRMLRYTVNNEVFGRAVEKFLDSYTATANHFWDVLEKTIAFSTFNMYTRMDSWIYSSKHPPVLKMTKNNSKSVMISVEDNYLLHETKPWIPVTQVTLQHDFEIKKDPDVIWLNPSNDPTKSYTTYIIDNNFHWIILNVEQAGYYRVNYETDNWLNISNYLNDINNYTNIHVLNRAQLIDDAFYFLKRGQLKLSAFHKLVEYLQYETDYVAWFPMFKGLESISTYFLFSESNDFLGTIKYVLIRLLRKIGFQENIVDDDLTKSMRQEAARWACTFNIMHCIRNAYSMLKYHLEHLDSHNLIQTIKINKRCDKHLDCEDGTDEEDCTCRDYLLNFHPTAICGGHLDCDDETDEKYCECAKSEIRCRNGECISKSAFCDGKVDCSNGADEPVICSCAEYLKLTTPERLCDGVRHCLDKTDESPEECQCTNASFKCNRESKNFTCISQDFVCDGDNDCPNGEDETDCTRIQQLTDRSAAGKVMQRSYGVWHTLCYPSEVTSQEEAVNVCKNSGYMNGIIDYKPDHYEITLEQQDEESNKILFNGTCLIFLRLLFTSREIYLHAQRPYIELYTIAAYKRNSTYANEPAIVTYNIIDHMYAISFKRDLIKGHYTLKLTFSTFLENNEENFFEMRYKSLIRDNEWMLATQCYPIGARHVFPCFDNPSFKATFNISIKHSDHYMVLSNMPVRNTSRVSNTMEWTHFHQTPVMSTYLVAIMLTQFPRTSVKEIKFIHRTLQSALDTEFAQKVIQNISLYFESEWLCFQKLPKVDHVVIPNFLRNGVEYWGLIYYRESAIICNEEFESVGRKVDVARLIAQKIAYQWYGNLISPLWWSDAWLYEGLTTILAADAINKIYPKFHIWDLFVVQIQQESLRLDSVMKPVASEVKTSSDLNSVFSFEYYLKGPALLRMLRYAVQTEVFDSAVKSFLDKYTASPIHFWNVLQETMNSSTVSYRRFDVEDMMDSWIYSSKRPVLKMTKNDSKSVVISVEDNYLRHETKPWIPVTRVTLKHDFEMYRDPDVIWLKPTNDRTKSYTNYIIDSNFHWIILNVEQAGYYRVNYETDNWRNIANYLNDINNYTNIHVLNRAQLIDDAFYFLNIGQLQLSVFLNLAEYLQYETDYVAWFPMFKGLEYISPYSMFPESNDFLVHITLYNNINIYRNKNVFI